MKDQDNTFQYLGALTNTLGNHNIKVGGAVIRRQLTSFQSGEPEGLWVFLNYSGLLQGEYLSTARSLQLYTPHLETWEPSVYAQDDWRFSKTLTVNLGLRYDIYTPYTETRNHISTFNAANGSLLVAGQGGVSNTAGVQTDHMGFAPRVGFAFSPGKEFVIRGGYGIGYFPANTTSNANLKNPPFVSTVSTCSYLSCGPGFTRFANGLPVPTPTSISSPGASIPDATATNFKTSYIQQFNLTTQKNVTGNVITLTYVGLLGRQLAQLLPDLNAPPPNACGTNASCYNALRPYFAVDPNLGQVGYLQTGGSSSYNAFEASVERRLSHGATANINYQFAHALDNSEAFLAGGAAADGFGTVPSRVSSLDYGNSSLDQKHRVAGTITYALPFGESAHGFKAVLNKGWQLNLLGSLSTGVPFTVVNATDVSNTNPGASNADRSNQIASSYVPNRKISAFFNTAAFQAQAPGTLGSERRNQLFGPDYRHLDVSAFKGFAITERLVGQFRAEVFNITNTSNFANPNASLGGANFGAITALSTFYQPRVIQFALKLSF